MPLKMLYLLPTLAVIAAIGAAQAFLIAHYFQGSAGENERITRMERTLAEKEIALNQLVIKPTSAIQKTEVPDRKTAEVR